MSMFMRFAAFLGGALLVVVGASAAYVDPPSRVARLSYIRGDVSFSPAGEDRWVNATRNRPLIRGDRLWTDRGARAELQAGNAVFRIDEGTSLQILNLDDRTAQLEITQGTLNLRVRRIYQDQIFEVNTPTLAFVVSRPGEYRIDVDRRGKHTTVAVWDGGGEAHGERANFRIREGEAIRFYDTRLRDYEVFDIPRPDEFDRFCLDRDQRYDRSISRRYVSEDLIGYSDLDEYGSWTEVTEYGNVWFPSRVSVDWAPYRDGHWIWQDPWGWTWVDDADWGFAPFHYGRWVHVRNRWGWIPGPISARPVYAPALVAFVGGSNFSVSVSTGRPIGWFPLGPREVYVPPYRASRNYFTSVNVTNTVINNTYITNVYNDYSSGRNVRAVNYHNREVAGAITAVSSDAFVNSRSVRQQRVAVDSSMVARAEVSQVAAFAPNERSIVGSGRAATAMPQREILDRAVVARTAPPAATVPFAERQAVLERTPGRGLSDDAMESLRTPRGGPTAAAPERVRVVGNGDAANTRSVDAERLERGAPPREDLRRGDRDLGAGSGRVAPEDRSEAPARTPTIRSDGTMTPPQRDFSRPGSRGDEAERVRPADRSEPSRMPREEAPQFERREEVAPVQREEAPARVRRNEAPQFERREEPASVQREEAPVRMRRNEAPQFERREEPASVQREEAPARMRRDEAPQFERREEPAPVQREEAPARMRREPAPEVREQPRFERREEPAPRMQEMPREQPVQRAPPPPPEPAPQEQRRGNDGGEDNGGRDDGDNGRRRRE
ncbi:MAG: FecR domain-containing protein [Rhodanobacteraceae bacterium]|nr:FecR domain-containing protein [Rhodanobacteraceae bacterium]